MLAALMPASAEEFVLKDGTKITGRMTAVKSDKIEVETPYGKMQIRRSDILTINFPENRGTAVSEHSSDPAKAKPVDESFTGTQYVNRTGHFTLTVPMDWKINAELRANTDMLAALSSRDNLRYLVVEKESFSGSLESYKGLVEIANRRKLTHYEKLSESNIQIDGRPAVLLFFRGTSPETQNLPVQFVTAIAAFDGEYLHAIAWCIEPLFNESQRTLENILLSYKNISDNSTARSLASTPLPMTVPASNPLVIDSTAQLAKIIESVNPVYPPLARQTRIQGTVRLHTIIGIDGTVEQLEVMSGHPLLIQSALDAVRKWRYAPTTLNGLPVQVDTTIDVIFELNK
jgi:TonB family protein